MQLLNSKILSDGKNTRYSNKKAQDTRVTCAFLSVVAFSYYKDGGDAGICSKHSLRNNGATSHTVLFKSHCRKR